MSKIFRHGIVSIWVQLVQLVAALACAWLFRYIISHSQDHHRSASFNKLHFKYFWVFSRRSTRIDRLLLLQTGHLQLRVLWHSDANILPSTIRLSYVEYNLGSNTVLLQSARTAD